MFKWIVSVALCLFLAEGSQMALAQNGRGVEDASVSSTSSRSSGPKAPVKRGAAPSGRGSGSAAAVKSGSGQYGVPAASPGARPVQNSVRANESSGAGGGPPGRASTRPSKKPDIRPDEDQKPGRPGRPDSDGKPGRPGHDGKPGRPGWDGNRPGGGIHPGRPGGHGSKPGRPHWDRCEPYCYGPTWYGYYYYDEPRYEDNEDKFGWEETVSEPLTYFAPGQFEPYADPRLDWAAEGDPGSGASGPPALEARPVSPSGRAQSEAEIRQYEQMMNVWR